MKPANLFYTRDQLDDAVEQLRALTELFQLLTTLDGSDEVSVSSFEPWAKRAMEAHGIVSETCSALCHHGFDDDTRTGAVHFKNEPLSTEDDSADQAAGATPSPLESKEPLTRSRSSAQLRQHFKATRHPPTLTRRRSARAILPRASRRRRVRRSMSSTG